MSKVAMTGRLMKMAEKCIFAILPNGPTEYD
jgi:hypothetical protein